MIMTYPTGGTIAAVDCQKQVRSWRLLRSLMGLLIPSCNCTSFLEENKHKQEKCMHNNYYCEQSSLTSTSCRTITGTIFGRYHGKVNFCIQTSPRSEEPILFLELAVPRAILAREMRGELLRIVLEYNSAFELDYCSLLSVPIWNMYCNEREAGFAVKRQASEADLEVLKKMESVVVGAGIINGKELGRDLHQLDDDSMCLRGKFHRVHCSCDAESFHLIDPYDNNDEELSVFFFRRR